MDKITLGQIAVAFAFMVGILTSVSFISARVKKWIRETLKEQLTAINNDIKSLSGKLDSVDLESCKNFLVAFLSDVEKGETIDEVTRQRFYEEYEHYSKIGGNSYIYHKVQQLQQDGLL